MVKNSPASVGDTRDAGLIPRSGRFPWRRAWQPTPVFLPGEPHGQKNPTGRLQFIGSHKTDTTEAT